MADAILNYLNLPVDAGGASNTLNMICRDGSVAVGDLLKISTKSSIAEVYHDYPYFSDKICKLENGLYASVSNESGGGTKMYLILMKLNTASSSAQVVATKTISGMGTSGSYTITKVKDGVIMILGQNLYYNESWETYESNKFYAESITYTSTSLGAESSRITYTTAVNSILQATVRVDDTRVLVIYGQSVSQKYCALMQVSAAGVTKLSECALPSQYSTRLDVRDFKKLNDGSFVAIGHNDSDSIWGMARISINGNTVRGDCGATYNDASAVSNSFPRQIIPGDQSEFFITGKSYAAKYRSTTTAFVEIETNISSSIVDMCYFKDGMDIAADISSTKPGSTTNRLMLGVYNPKDLSPIYVGADIGGLSEVYLYDVFQDGDYIVITGEDHSSSRFNITQFRIVDAKRVTRTVLSAVPIGRALEINGTAVTMSIV